MYSVSPKRIERGTTSMPSSSTSSPRRSQALSVTMRTVTVPPGLSGVGLGRVVAGRVACWVGLVGRVVKRPGLVEVGLSRRRLLLGAVVMVVVRFELGGSDVVDLAAESDFVEPPDPFQGGEFEIVGAAPGAFMSNAFGL